MSVRKIGANISGAVDMIGGAGSPQSRRVVAGMGRAELEDKQLGLLEENHVRHPT